MNPELLKMMMPFLAGAGLREFTSSVKDLMKSFSGGGQPPAGGKPGATPQAVQPGVPSAGAAPGQLPPQIMAMLAQMIQARNPGAVVQ
jgi:hypothetical protein